MFGILGGRHPRCHDGVEKPGAIQVHGNPVFQRHGSDAFNRCDWVDGPSTGIMGVLHGNQARLNSMGILGSDRGFDLLGRHDATFRVNPVELKSREGSRGALLVPDHMGPPIRDDLLARLRQDSEADLIRHRA